MFDEFMKYSKGDRRVIIILFCLATILVSTLLVLDIIQNSKLAEQGVTSDSQRNISSSSNKRSKGVNKTFTPHAFNPNTIDSLSLVSFGVKPWKVKNFLHYREGGKRFYSPEDILATYGWEDSDYELIAEYVQFEERPSVSRHNTSSRNHNTPSYSNHNSNLGGTSKPSIRAHNDSAYIPKYIPAKFKTLTKVNLNSADTTVLCSIPGIGKKTSEAIIRRREKLGGFIKVEQLMEISLVSQEMLEWFEEPSPKDIRKININKDSFQRLSSHPYIQYNHTRDIIQYRRLYGDIKNAEQLLSTGIFTKDELERLTPYLEY